MDTLEAELERVQTLDVSELADAIEAIGFECTRCGACCTAAEAPTSSDDDDPIDGANGDGDSGEVEAHTATVFPDEVRRLQEASGQGSDREYDWRDVARPMPYGLRESTDGPEGETFEWALWTDECGDCTFYEERDGGDTAPEADGTGYCTVHDARPLICRTYPFSVALPGTSQPMGSVVDQMGEVCAHECEGLGREISHADAEELARALKERAVRELQEAIAVRDNYEPTDATGVVVYDSEGAKRPDGTLLSE